MIISFNHSQAMCLSLMGSIFLLSCGIPTCHLCQVLKITKLKKKKKQGSYPSISNIWGYSKMLSWEWNYWKIRFYSFFHKNKLLIIWLVSGCLLAPATHMHMHSYTQTHSQIVASELQCLLVSIRFHQWENPTGDWRSNGTMHN